ncbi:MAG: AMP-binding protein [Alphaproteobacteria bacterium]|nr:AMP-binding protein [Alphaproteobacteria bacterium]
MPNIYQVARYHALRRPEALALADRTRRIGYPAFHAMIRRVAGMVAAAGAGPGQRVVALLENSMEYLALYHATALGRFILVPANVRFGAEEFSFLLSDSDPALVLFDNRNAALAETARRWANDRGVVMRNVEQEGWGETPFACDAQTDRFGAAEDEEVALILYTSGTTSRPKGAMITHGNLAWNCINYLVEAELTSRSRSILTTPLFHIAGHGVLNGPVMYAGGALYIMPRFDAEELWQVLHEFRPTNLSLLSAMWVLFTDRYSSRDGTFPEVQTVQTAASPLSQARQDEIQRMFPNAEWIWGFGMTETCVTTIRTRNMAEMRAHPGTMGQPWRHIRFRLADEAGRTITEPGTVGEFQVKGPTVFKGYWREPPAGGAAFTADGWLRTGDLFHIDAEEYTYFVGRSKDMIKTGGENVAALEVETCLLQHPDVQDAAAFGLPHDLWGEELVAAVVARAGRNIDTEALMAHARAHLSGFKTPKRLFVIAELPRSSSGKVQKFRLQEQLR